MANVTKINLDGTAYDIVDASARSTASAAQTTANRAYTSASGAQTTAADAKKSANAAETNTVAIAAKAVTVKYNSEETSLVVTTGIALS